MSDEQKPHPAEVETKEVLDLMAAAARMAATASCPTYFKTAYTKAKAVVNL